MTLTSSLCFGIITLVACTRQSAVTDGGRRTREDPEGAVLRRVLECYHERPATEWVATEFCRQDGKYLLTRDGIAVFSGSRVDLEYVTKQQIGKYVVHGKSVVYQLSNGHVYVSNFIRHSFSERQGDLPLAFGFLDLRRVLARATKYALGSNELGLGVLAIDTPDEFGKPMHVDYVLSPNGCVMSSRIADWRIDFTELDALSAERTAGIFNEKVNPFSLPVETIQDEFPLRP